MKFTSRGYRHFPLEPVDEGEALKVSEVPSVEYDEIVEKEKSRRS